MEYRQLGRTDLQVSKICLGTMTFGQQNTEAEAHEQMSYAVEQGINFFDTAELYAVPARAENNGLTEKYIGTWLKKSKKRKKIILATKITGANSNLKFIRNHQLDFSKTQIHAALEGSLTRLKTDYVDLYQLHWPQRNTNCFGKLGFTYDPNDNWQDDFLNVLQTMGDLVKAGKIRHWGLSNETAWGLMHVIRMAEKHNLPVPVSIQNPYSLLSRSFEIGLSECSIRENCGLLAYSPMGFGLLSGKFHKKQDTPDDRINKFKNLARYNSPLSWAATEKYLALSEKHGLSLAQMALAFVTQQHFTTSTIIGATSMAQLKENINSAELILSADILSEINEIHQEIPNPAP
ncbi:MAG: aldo/keto reductase [Saprospiraceae bacterium]|nr:aldo/keto reductase [Saprospiraceae bacterium]